MSAFAPSTDTTRKFGEVRDVPEAEDTPTLLDGSLRTITRSWRLRAPPILAGHGFCARRLLPSHLPKAAVARTGTSNGGT